jgi:hypothetical protein
MVQSIEDRFRRSSHDTTTYTWTMSTNDDVPPPRLPKVERQKRIIMHLAANCNTETARINKGITRDLAITYVLVAGNNKSSRYYLVPCMSRDLVRSPLLCFPTYLLNLGAVSFYDRYFTPIILAKSVFVHFLWGHRMWVRSCVNVASVCEQENYLTIGLPPTTNPAAGAPKEEASQLDVCPRMCRRIYSFYSTLKIQSRGEWQLILYTSHSHIVIYAIIIYIQCN